jgi:hypothetical protein
MIIVITAIVVFLLLRASDISLNLGIKYLEFQGIENDLNPVPGADNGFVVNPYQTGNPEQNQAIIMGASISYILREVKSFTMFAIILAVLALIAYVIIAYIVLNKLLNPIVKTEEPQKNEEAGIRNEDYVNNNNDSDNKELNNCIEDRPSSTALLSLSIDEMLSDIDTAMEKSRVKWSVSL